ncbi:hypothetical protein ACHQM5_010827 [Ranunculus cassubicifolius]
MAASSSIPVAEPVHEIPSWLKSLPLAPEYHPTLSEFEDPISYILKIEKEASRYGICKIVPPVSLPSKKTTIGNLNRSLAARNINSNSKSQPTFTTRYQQIGFDPRKGRPVQKPVWQSGEYYTVQEFEVKAKLFEKIYLKRCANKKEKGYSALEVETLFWRATVDKPFNVEYANDMPGSAFVSAKPRNLREAGDTATVGETAWNMRGVARSKGSLLRFMKEEIPGVTSPMVYIAMLFSWFAWHVEDHDLHSLNYMHMGASKTWYGVPKDAAIAFQEVVRLHGYGGDFNPLVTFAILGEKTTVMSPEVLIGAGIPCCRLVQNVGEFVVTFPGAYHSGFSHGFNCAEASNIATPEWLRFAKEAAIRRASVNCPPMVSHFQLLYALALTLCSRVPMSISNEPRSSRLKDKKRGEGEGMVKEFFLQSMIENNVLLHVLSSNGSPCVLVPRKSSEISVCLNRCTGNQKKVQPRMSFGFCSDYEASKILPSDENSLERNAEKETSNSVVDETDVKKDETDVKRHISESAGLLEQGRFPCVQCGILSFACAAVVEPREVAAQYFMSADCSFFNEWKAGGGVLKGKSAFDTDYNPNLTSGGVSKNDDLYAVPVQSEVDVVSDSSAPNNVSSLSLLASAYGNSSDSDEEMAENDDNNVTTEKLSGDMPVNDPDNQNQTVGHLSYSRRKRKWANVNVESTSQQTSDLITTQVPPAKYNDITNRPLVQMSTNPDSSRKHIFCLEHALEVEKQLRPIGGANIVLLCHPEYQEVEEEAKSLAQEMGIDHIWKDLSFKEATKEDQETISLALQDEESDPSNGDWAVKLGINLYYSVHLSKSPLYAKQMPYNSIIYNAFGCNSTNSSSMEVRKKKIVVAGKWCGKVWMSNQVHPYLTQREVEEDFKPTPKPQRKPTARKPGPKKRKKKTRFGKKKVVKKEKSPQFEAEGSSESDSRMFQQNNNTRFEMSPEFEYPEEEEYSGSDSRKFRQKNARAVKSPEFEYPEEEGSSESDSRKFQQRKITRFVTSPEFEPPEEESSESDSRKFQQTKNMRYARLATKKENSPEYESPEEEEASESDSPVRNGPRSRFTTGVKSIKQYDLNSKAQLQGQSAGNEKKGRFQSSIQTEEEEEEEDSSESDCSPLNSNSSRFLKGHSEGGPSSRLRRRPKPTKPVKEKPKPVASAKKQRKTKKPDKTAPDSELEFQCDLDGCTMGFTTKQELVLHKRNICSFKGCGKKFFSHKYLVQHRRVHTDERPLKCPWKGCKMTFKWAWARTEHIRVHTGERPYVCGEKGCGQTFRFVSDFSRHKRKTGHVVKGKK